MELYKGSAEEFIDETTRNRIALDLANAFRDYYGFEVPGNERLSWHNSLRAIKDIFVNCGLKNQGIDLEYFLPGSSKRLDCLVAGKDSENNDHAYIIELKQWEHTQPCDDENEVVTKLDGRLQEIQHPSKQVEGYRDYLSNYVEAFYQEVNPIKVSSCVYLHNYEFEKNDAILDKKFNALIKRNPLFGARDFDKLSRSVKSLVSYGEGMSILTRIDKSAHRPSKKLMDEAASIIKGNPVYTLLDEQQVAYDHIIKTVEKSLKDRSKKHVIIIKGGPGTGKSVIAINILAQLSKEHRWANYVTGSGAFTKSYQKAIGTAVKGLFKYTNSYVMQKDVLDCLLVDEAHRLRERAPAAGPMFAPKITSGKPQIQELIDACRVAVFFIDDDQRVKPDEVGSVEYIKEHAKEYGCDIWETELKVQFRCAGNDRLVRWLDNTLEIHHTADTMLKKSNDFDFQIMDSPLQIENALKEKIKEGNTARIVSGFVFPWSKDPAYGEPLPNDVVIGEYKRPWNLRKPHDGNPDSSLWAYKPEGFNQIGCIYSCQGFEFDYIGVIFGNDIVYDFSTNSWIPRRENFKDPIKRNIKTDDDYLRLVKNIYRVLLSRGMKGCYVYFMDEDTRKFVSSRIEKEKTSPLEPLVVS